MTLRKTFKHWLYGSCPGFAGSFPYFGTRVYFPKNSLSFTVACEQGIFEADNLRLLQSLVRPDTTYFDIGANIGLMAVPILYHEPRCRVISFEPSSNVLPSLQRTLQECQFRERWSLVTKAVSARCGRVNFSLSDPIHSLFDGLHPTNRVASARQVEVETTTLDETWRASGSPRVSVLKCDVEGAELDVLKGAVQCLRTERPFVLLEWNAENLAAYGCPQDTILEFALAEKFVVYAMPTLTEVRTSQQLQLQMIITESFLLAPVKQV